MSDLFKRNCAVLAQWYAGECKEVLQAKSGPSWIAVYSVDGEDIKSFEFRLKPRTIILVNSIEVPEPVRTAPKDGEQVWFADPYDACLCWSSPWQNTDQKIMALDSGLVHMTAEERSSTPRP